MLSDAANWLNGILQNFEGTSVTLRRRQLETTATATKGRTAQLVDTEFGVLNVRTQDWIMPTADYAFNSAAVTPNRGDTIQEDGGDTFEVMGDQQGVHWDYMDQFRQMIRVRTNRIENG